MPSLQGCPHASSEGRPCVGSTESPFSQSFKMGSQLQNALAQSQNNWCLSMRVLGNSFVASVLVQALMSAVSIAFQTHLVTICTQILQMGILSCISRAWESGLDFQYTSWSIEFCADQGINLPLHTLVFCYCTEKIPWLQRCKHFEIGGDKKGKNQMY